MEKYFKKYNNKNGFVLLYVVLISSIILTITLSITDMSYREISLSSDARETNFAFFAADAGAECALLNDKASSTSFVQTGGSGIVTCFDIPITINQNIIGDTGEWSFVLNNLGSDGDGCARVNVQKNFTELTTIIISKGYNSGGENNGFCDQGINSIERQIELYY